MNFNNYYYLLSSSTQKQTNAKFTNNNRNTCYSSSSARVASTFTPIRFSLFCIFNIFCIFNLPTGALGAVIPAMAAFGDDFGDGGTDGVDACCRRHSVPEVCRKTLCNPSRPPNDFDVYDVFERRNNCSGHLKPISHCLAAGRDHSACCEREAKDGDEHICFGMCKGEGRCAWHDAWTQYQTCLAINIRSMFECFVRGYENAPTPPRKLAVERADATSASLVWHAPAIHAHLVVRYVVYAYQLDDETEEAANAERHVDDDESPISDASSSELFFETDEPRIVLGSLEPGTNYRAYTVAVTGESRRSLRSKHVDFQTSGVAPRVSAFKSTVSISRNASSVLLACNFKVNGVSKAKTDIVWRYRTSTADEFVALDPSRYNQVSFVYSVSKPREHVATLEINALNANDFGVYRCQISDAFGEGFADVELKPVELHNPPPSVPPPTPLACCREREVDARCLPMCGGTTTSSEMSTRRYVARPFMPSNCSGDISKVLSCAMPEVDDSACCLRQRIPRQCMYLCDSSVEPSNQMAAVCLEHVDAVVQCRMAGVDKRPTAVSGLRIDTGGVGIGASAPQSALVSWEAAKGAEIYHVYWRRKPAEDDADEDDRANWQQKSQVLTSRKVHDADEIVVVAANSYGSSQASKIVFDVESSKWTRIS